MSIWGNLPDNLIHKILSDKEIPVDTKLELEKDFGVKLFNPYLLSDNLKKNLERIYSRKPVHNYGVLKDVLLYKSVNNDEKTKLEVFYSRTAPKAIQYLFVTPSSVNLYYA